MKNLARNSNHYRKVIKCWTEKDVEKRETVIKNNLNFIAFWDDKLSDFHEWIDMGMWVEVLKSKKPTSSLEKLS